MPYIGHSWQPETKARPLAHEYSRNGTAKLMTLLHPASGQVRVQGTRSCTNPILHDWLQEQLEAILSALPPPKLIDEQQNRLGWQRWQQGLTYPITLPDQLPPLQLLLVLDNLAGHKTPSFVLWLFAHGIMPLYTPLGGSWLNMAESIQRIIKRRALEGHHPQTPEQIIDWLQATATGWNADPTPFEWGGKRAHRRQRSRERRHSLGGSYAFTRRAIRRAQRNRHYP